jgi:hypothetical protein
MSYDSWQVLKSELSEMAHNEEYKMFRPLLERLQHMVSAEYPELDIVSGLLHVVKHIRKQVYQGNSLQELVNEAAKGYIQPEWEVQGNINQAGRDIFRDCVIKVFNNAQSELKFEDPDPGIEVPIVLLVMKAVEAEELISGEAFTAYPDLHKQFQSLRETLENKYNTKNWLDRYEEVPKDWHPFSDTENGNSIKQIVTQVLNNIPRSKDNASPFIPNFHNIQNLVTPSNQDLLCELRYKGCIVIIDSVSMYHPKILRSSQQSALVTYPRTSVVTISPGYSVLKVMRDMIVVIRLRVSDLEFAKRIEDVNDDAREEIQDHGFKKWLAGRIMKMYPNEVSGVRSHMFSNMKMEDL